MSKKYEDVDMHVKLNDHAVKQTEKSQTITKQNQRVVNTGLLALGIFTIKKEYCFK